MPKHTLQSLLVIQPEDPHLEDYRRFIEREMVGVRSQVIQKKAEEAYWGGKTLTTPGVDTKPYDAQMQASMHEVSQTLANLVAKYNDYQARLDSLPPPIQTAVSEEAPEDRSRTFLKEPEEPTETGPIGPVSDELRATAE